MAETAVDRIALTNEEIASDFALIDPYNIDPGARIRPVRNEGVQEVLRSVLESGIWSTSHTIIVYRDPDKAEDALPPRYMCVDGMHRVRAIRQLAADNFSGWPEGWYDASTGKLSIGCQVLRKPLPPKKLIHYAIMLNDQTQSVVRTSYLDTLMSIDAARSIAARELPGKSVIDSAFKRLIIQMTFTGHRRLRPETIRKDITILHGLEQDGAMALIMEIAERYGHGWFTRNNVSILLKTECDKFLLRVVKSWLDKSVIGHPAFPSDIPEEDFQKGKAFMKVVKTLPFYYSMLCDICNAAHGTSLPQPCCKGDERLLNAMYSHIADAMLGKGLETEPVLQMFTGENPTLEELIRQHVERRTKALAPPTPPRLSTLPPPSSQLPVQSPTLQVAARAGDVSTPPTGAAPSTSAAGVSIDGAPTSVDADVDVISTRRSSEGRGPIRVDDVDDDDSNEEEGSDSDAADSEDRAPFEPDENIQLEFAELEEVETGNSEIGGMAPVLTRQDAADSGSGDGAEQSSSSKDAEAGSTADNDSGGDADGHETRDVRRSSRMRTAVEAFSPDELRAPKRRSFRRESSEAFDDDPAKPAIVDGNSSQEEDDPLVEGQRRVTPPSVIPRESAIHRKFKLGELDRLWSCQVVPGGGSTRLFKIDFHVSRLQSIGYCIIRDVFPEHSADAGVSKAIAMSRADVDELFGFFREAWNKDGHLCCASADTVSFDTIVNSHDVSQTTLDSSKRRQTPRASIHQHLESYHRRVFKLKLRLDAVCALLLSELSVESRTTCTYSIPRTGARLLLSEPECPLQPPHTDFPVRYTQSGAPVPDPSYFLILTGSESASVVVWPGSHEVVAYFERTLEACRTHNFPPGTLIKRRRDVDEQENELCRSLPSQRVAIPPYSTFVCRGDLVHAGDAHGGAEVAIRAHIHCTANKDIVYNNVFMKPFSE